MGFHRSSSFSVDTNGIRQQHNNITAYNDIYLSSLEDIFALDLADTTLSNVIGNNSSITTIQDNAFLVGKAKSTPEPSELIYLLGLGVFFTGSRIIKSKN